MSVTVAEVSLWGTRVGAVQWDPDTGLGAYEYDRAFRASGVQLAPLMMPLGPGVWRFPALSRDTYKGLPGMLADSLPDKFGMTLIDAWLIQQGRAADSFSPLERLCYVGSRGMGALEFAPALDTMERTDSEVDLANLVALAQRALADRAALRLRGSGAVDDHDLTEIIQVGTSAGGARAKAVIAWNESTGEIRSGQLDLPAGFTHWLIKFDGVDANRDKELADPLGYGRIEAAYAEMARAAGITMAPTRLLEEGGRAHFMTQRFDRIDGDRRHLQSLSAMAHYDFNLAGAYSYEAAIQVMRRLNLGADELVEQYRRAVFNVVARNQDDHTKNIAFLMDRQGRWSLSPAFDMTYSYNPSGAWTSSHQMTINGKRDDFTGADLAELAIHVDLTARETTTIVDEVTDVVDAWPTFATASNVDPALSHTVQANLRLAL